VEEERGEAAAESKVLAISMHVVRAVLMCRTALCIACAQCMEARTTACGATETLKAIDAASAPGKRDQFEEIKKNEFDALPSMSMLFSSNKSDAQT
jgi:hypothetical protein